eukprot:scaffold191809_cov18-Prasinocladus_malaysianus.AAC.1
MTFSHYGCLFMQVNRTWWGEERAAAARLEGQMGANAEMLAKLEGQLEEAKRAAEEWEAQRAARIRLLGDQQEDCARLPK